MARVGLLIAGIVFIILSFIIGSFLGSEVEKSNVGTAESKQMANLNMGTRIEFWGVVDDSHSLDLGFIDISCFHVKGTPQNIWVYGNAESGDEVIVRGNLWKYSDYGIIIGNDAWGMAGKIILGQMPDKAQVTIIPTIWDYISMGLLYLGIFFTIIGSIVLTVSIVKNRSSLSKKRSGFTQHTPYNGYPQHMQSNRFSNTGPQTINTNKDKPQSSPIDHYYEYVQLSKQKDQRVIQCYYCGEENTERASFCKYCGEKMKENPGLKRSMLCAGIVLMISGIFGILIGPPILMYDQISLIGNMSLFLANYQPLTILFSIFAVVSGILCLVRRMYYVSIIFAMLSIFAVGPYCIFSFMNVMAAILVLSSYHNYLRECQTDRSNELIKITERSNILENAGGLLVVSGLLTFIVLIPFIPHYLLSFSPSMAVLFREHSNITIFFMTMSLLGGVLCYMRYSFILVFTCSIIGIFSIGPFLLSALFNVIAVIAVAIYHSDFYPSIIEKNLHYPFKGRKETRTMNITSAQSKDISQPLTQYQPQPHAQYHSQPQTQYQPRPQSQYYFQPQTQYQPRPQSQYYFQPQAQYQPQPQSQYDFQSQPQSNAQNRPQPQDQNQPKTQAQHPSQSQSLATSPIAENSATYSTVEDNIEDDWGFEDDLADGFQ